MKWSQAVCASILVEGLYPPAVKVDRLGGRDPEGRFQQAFLIFGVSTPDDRFRPLPHVSEPSSLADLHKG